ncbi:MAG: DUF1934 domain-containing protein [Clostridia bacterium]|nr:DUF1934 domain-containing protein [Clostridia bacterium]
MESNESAIMITMTGTNDTGDETSLSTDGVLEEQDDDSFTLHFEELGESGPILTIVECDGQHVTIIRASGTGNAMSFRQGNPYESQYETPIGPIHLSIFPTEVLVRRRGQRGHVRLVYQVSFWSRFSPSQDVSVRRLDLRFRPCGH